MPHDQIIDKYAKSEPGYLNYNETVQFMGDKAINFTSEDERFILSTFYHRD